MTNIFGGLGSNAKAASGDVVPGLPASWIVGCLFICTIVSKDNVNSTMPAGWIPIDAGTNNGAGLRTTCYYKMAVAGDTDPTVTHTGGSYISADIVNYYGVDPINPIDVIGTTTVNTPATATVTANAITTLQNNATVIFTGGDAVQCTFATYNGSPTPAERLDRPNSANYPSHFLADFVKIPAGDTSNRIVTASSASGVNNGLLFSIRALEVADLGPNNITGYNNARPGAVAGKIGDAISFDGNLADFVEIPYNALLHPTSAITASCWVYVADWTVHMGYPEFFSCTEVGGYDMFLDQDFDTATFDVYRNGTYGSPAASTLLLSSGWHHFVGTYDGRYAKIYVDGVLKDTNDAGANYPITYTYNNSLFIGAEAGTANQPVDAYITAYIDEFTMWDNAKDQTFVTALYNSGNGRIIDKNEVGLIGYWIGEMLIPTCWFTM